MSISSLLNSLNFPILRIGESNCYLVCAIFDYKLTKANGLIITCTKKYLKVTIDAFT